MVRGGWEVKGSRSSPPSRLRGFVLECVCLSGGSLGPGAPPGCCCSCCRGVANKRGPVRLRGPDRSAVEPPLPTPVISDIGATALPPTTLAFLTSTPSSSIPLSPVCVLWLSSPEGRAREVRERKWAVIRSAMGPSAYNTGSAASSTRRFSGIWPLALLEPFALLTAVVVEADVPCRGLCNT